LREALDLISGGFFSHGDRELFRPLVDSLLERDEYMLLADYQPYVDCHAEVDRAYADAEHWTRMSILNVARMGKFSSDRAVREYAREIWAAEPVPIALEGGVEMSSGRLSMRASAPRSAGGPRRGGCV
jgi:starch phosphorylase